MCVEEDASLPGFIRLKMLGVGAEVWREYVDVAGRLRRDLVKAKLANLLATAIKRGISYLPNSLVCGMVHRVIKLNRDKCGVAVSDVGDQTDDRICVSPGQVVDAEVLDKILKQPDHCRIFYGSGNVLNYI